MQLQPFAAQHKTHGRHRLPNQRQVFRCTVDRCAHQGARRWAETAPPCAPHHHPPSQMYGSAAVLTRGCVAGHKEHRLELHVSLRLEVCVGQGGVPLALGQRLWVGISGADGTKRMRSGQVQRVRSRVAEELLALALGQRLRVGWGDGTHTALLSCAVQPCSAHASARLPQHAARVMPAQRQQSQHSAWCDSAVATLSFNRRGLFR